MSAPAPTSSSAGLVSPPAGSQLEEPSRAQKILREILGGSAIMSVLAVVLAMAAGLLLIGLTDPNWQQKVGASAGYFFAKPADFFAAFFGPYIALFQGSVYNFGASSFALGIRPLTETLAFATPLIAAGLGVGLAFRVGLFNIGGRGQMLIAAACAGWVSWSFPMLPGGVHLIFAVVAGILGGAIWGGIVGLLKARTGAHEVIVTIMLNFVALYLVQFLLKTPGALQAPGSNNPKTPAAAPTAVFPDLVGPSYNLHWGFIFVIAATVYVWYLLNRSSMGFRFRAVGENPAAALTAGINVKNVYVYAMLISGGLVGLAGVSQVLGTVTTGFSVGIDAGIGFDAITVALLGRSKPWGIFGAGILFGAFKAGGFAMQASQQIPIDIVLVVQSLIVLFIAAPPLIRGLFRLPDLSKPMRKRTKPVAKAGAAA